MESYTKDEPDDKNIYEFRQLLPIFYYKPPYNIHRRTKALIIDCCMNKYDPFRNLPKITKENYVKCIEKSCYKQACLLADNRNIPKNWENSTFIRIYSDVTHNVQKNLLWTSTDIGSDYLIKNIIDGKIEAKNIGSMSFREMRPLKSKLIYDEIELRRQQVIVKKYSTQYKCLKCGGRKTTEIEKQLRCSDEGSTVIITCEMENCTNVWTQ